MDTFAFDAVVYSDTFTHSRYVGYRAKDELVDYFMEQEGMRPGGRLDNPDLRFHIHIAQEEVTLALDSSGESLHKRSWRAVQTEAPMSEVLAAGILRLAGWDGQGNFIDSMWGAGTLLSRQYRSHSTTPVWRGWRKCPVWEIEPAELLEPHRTHATGDQFAL